MPFDDLSLSLCYLSAAPLLHSECMKLPQAISGIAGCMRTFPSILHYQLLIGPVSRGIAYYPHSRVTISSTLNTHDQRYRADAQVYICTGSHTLHTYITTHPFPFYPH